MRKKDGTRSRACSFGLFARSVKTETVDLRVVGTIYV